MCLPFSIPVEKSVKSILNDAIRNIALKERFENILLSHHSFKLYICQRGSKSHNVVCFVSYENNKTYVKFHNNLGIFKFVVIAIRKLEKIIPKEFD